VPESALAQALTQLEQGDFCFVSDSILAIVEARFTAGLARLLAQPAGQKPCMFVYQLRDALGYPDDAACVAMRRLFAS
jgi:hypothetical protein